MNALTIHKPKMATAAKHKKILMPFVDDNGAVTSREVHGATELIPYAECDIIISELSTSLFTCSSKDSIVLAKMLIGCYRVKDVMDPGIYTRTIAEMFALFPPDIGYRVRNDIVGRVKWVPSPSEVKESGDKMMMERRAALYAAQKHKAEHDRRRESSDRKSNKASENGNYESDLKKRYEAAGLEWPGIKEASILKVAMFAGLKDNANKHDTRPTEAD